MSASCSVCSGSVIPKCSPKFGAVKFVSTNNIFFPNSCANTVPRLMTVVVFPTPPLIEIIPIISPIFPLLCCCYKWRNINVLLCKTLYKSSVFNLLKKVFDE